MNFEDMRDRILSFLMDESVGSKKYNELRNIFCFDKKSSESFETAIQDLVDKGEIFISKKQKVAALEKFNMKKGTFRGNYRGYGFVTTSDDNDDIFIPSDDVNGALDGDIVIAKIVEDKFGDKNSEGVVIRVIERKNSRIIGEIELNKSFAFVVPDNKNIFADIFIPKKYISGAKNGDKVVVEIIKWAEDDRESHEGKVVEVLGKNGDHGTEIEALIRAKGIDARFPEKVMRFTDNIPDQVREEDIKDRLDLRDNLIYTIDGDDSKDFDDAIEVKKLENGNYYLGVHIADVAEYVTRNSSLDSEAYKRATSVYLADRVIPMLPEKLSNGICSLNPDVDRLTLSCMMEIDPKNASVVKYDIRESVIRSKLRMTYSEVNMLYKYLDGEDIELKDKKDINSNDELISNSHEDHDADSFIPISDVDARFSKENIMNKYHDFVDSLVLARELSEIIRNKRVKKGSLDFDLPEYKVVLDENNMPVDFIEYDRGISNMMIEDFMVLANEVVSEHYYWMSVPFLYRVHETPDSEKMESLRNSVIGRGYRANIDPTNVRPFDLQRILNSIDNEDDKENISGIMLRSLKQARYSSDALGHFGLALEYYSHFTSPIRRYPDLFIHRIIKEILNNKFSDSIRNQTEFIIDEVAAHTSERERNAELLERDVLDYFKAVYMKDKVGDIFEGKISGVTGFGIFVKLENGIEGLIRYSSFPSFLIYEEETQTAVDEDTGKIYKIGDPMKVYLLNVSVSQRNIDFTAV